MRSYQRIVEPTWEAASFNCPHCGALASQAWLDAHSYDDGIDEYILLGGHTFSMCQSCQKLALWVASERKYTPSVAIGGSRYTYSNYRLVYPSGEVGPQPHPDMPQSVASLFEEASAVMRLSPRASAALARLSLEELCKELGAEGRDLKARIVSLVKEKNLNIGIQRLLTVVRCFGNDAVHNGGEIIIVEDSSDAATLLGIVNELVDRLIAEPKREQELFERIPEKRRGKLVDPPASTASK